MPCEVMIKVGLQTRHTYHGLSPSSPDMDSILAVAKEHQTAMLLGLAGRTPIKTAPRSPKLLSHCRVTLLSSVSISRRRIWIAHSLATDPPSR
ncbi:hypothetical protein KVR01_008243 [Diaporthe batatas]|uniref:uncharacterized protein n=1 Tax=Diaporthe batatas TaxID=748121 RepID=UPI001D04D967|nr:uncharacterized protein KVR01_008243 [Diaporthe batatas]KAG8162478.1 hypothetical protein KVR01_008243 [Diaporthe batatas]